MHRRENTHRSLHVSMMTSHTNSNRTAPLESRKAQTTRGREESAPHCPQRETHVQPKVQQSENPKNHLKNKCCVSGETRKETKV